MKDKFIVLMDLRLLILVDVKNGGLTVKDTELEVLLIPHGFLEMFQVFPLFGNTNGGFMENNIVKMVQPLKELIVLKNGG
jgi:hypothetical protein